MPQAWKFSRQAQIHLKEWSDEFVVFDELTTSTHLLGPGPGAVLLTLRDSGKALTIDDLQAHLGISSDDSSQSAIRQIGNILNELEQLELIESETI